ncbi:hypothetical protein WG66_014900 [Moniliophthora roreri]|nr:hypothetical protein WG66_014900 [Moniliophthora roreri]
MSAALRVHRNHFGPHPRSSSVTSSIHRDPSPFPSERQPGVQYFVADLSFDYEGGSAAQSKNYRPRVGSKATANASASASASRRKKAAKFFCKENLTVLPSRLHKTSSCQAVQMRCEQGIRILVLRTSRNSSTQFIMSLFSVLLTGIARQSIL